MLTTAIETLTGSNKSDSSKESLLPPNQLARFRSKSLSILPSADTKLRRKLSKLHNLDGCQIFTINEHSPTGSGGSKSVVTSSGDPSPTDHGTNSQVTAVPKRHKSAKIRRGTRAQSSKVPDITDFPLLVTSPTELAAATRRKYSRAKSAPLIKLKTDPKSDALLDEESRALLGSGDERTSTASKTKGSYQVADNANYREQRQLERQLKGIQSLQRMNISSINKEKMHILKNSKALSSMLYPDVFTGKKPRCTRKGKCFGTGNVDPEPGDSFESGTYLCDPSDGKSPYARKTWNNAVSMVLKSSSKKGALSKPNSASKKK